MVTVDTLKNYTMNNTISVAIYKILATELKIDNDRWEYHQGIYFIDGEQFTNYNALGIIDLIPTLRSEHKFKKIAEKLNEFVLSYKLNLVFPD